MSVRLVSVSIFFIWRIFVLVFWISMVVLVGVLFFTVVLLIVDCCGALLLL
jgi:hypothetical protein